MIRFNKILDWILIVLLMGCGVLFIINGILTFTTLGFIAGLILGGVCIAFSINLHEKYKTRNYNEYNNSKNQNNFEDEHITINKRNNEHVETINAPTDYIILDTETTGLIPRYDDIIEIGAIKIKNGVVVDRFHTYCKPLKKIKNSKIHNITNEMVENYKYSKYYMNDLINFTEGLPILIYNADFDTKMINVQLEENLKNDIIDILKLAKDYDIRESYKLENIKNDLGINNISHNAISDCETTKYYYDYLIQTYKLTELPTFYSDNVEGVKRARSITYADELLKVYIPEQTIENEKLKDKIFVFTGDLKSMTRVNAAKKVIENGGIYHPRIILKANYLVVGDLDKETGKLEKANLYNNEKGADIKIIYEDDFLNLLNK